MTNGPVETKWFTARRLWITPCGTVLFVLSLAVASCLAQAPVISNISRGLRFTVHSPVGVSNQIQWTNTLGTTDWSVLTNLMVANSPYEFVDTTATSNSTRFYRVLMIGTVTNAVPPLNMVLIPAGPFAMGDTFAEGLPEERPTHVITVSAFYMDQYEVTKAIWDEVKFWSETNGYSYDNPGLGKAQNHPVQSLNWYDCVKWCNARSQKEGLTPVYYTDPSLATVFQSGQVTNPSAHWDANGYRLPTEAEWEKAARGGIAGRRFPWGDTITHELANYASSTNISWDVSETRGYHPTYATNGTPYTSPAGSFAPNAYGLYDIIGNVWERCWDWYGYQYYESSLATDPRGPAVGEIRVVRGGAYNAATGTRCGARGTLSPRTVTAHVGFRCVRRL